MAYSTDMYPVQFDVEYPESRNRLTALVRLILAIPIVIIISLIAASPMAAPAAENRDGDRDRDGEGVEASGGFSGFSETMNREFAALFSLDEYAALFSWDGNAADGSTADTTTQSVFQFALQSVFQFALVYTGLSMAIALMILFRKKYPRWWFNWNLELARFNARIAAYIFLLRDEYPSTDEEQAVSLDIAYPDAEQLNRVMPLIKWLLAIPHFIVLFLLGILAFFVTIIAWFAILIVGRYPRGLFNFTVGLMRWGNRVFAYATLLTTDRYPPFRFGP